MNSTTHGKDLGLKSRMCKGYFFRKGGGRHFHIFLISQILSLLQKEKLYLQLSRFYVSKIKEQHKKLHSAEQILRAELAEKRQVLKGLRKVQ